jgi:hypothetical protein
VTSTLRISLEEGQYRRLHAVAGRRQLQPEALVRELIATLIDADVPGKINPVLRAIDPPPTGPTVRHCHWCGKTLPLTSTRRRKYCGASCRVAGNRANVASERIR